MIFFKIARVFFAFTLACIFQFSAQAANDSKSFRTEIFDNPFVVIAENPKNNVITGYLEALRTSPGRTDVCKVYFRGVQVENGTSVLSMVDAISAPSKKTTAKTIPNGIYQRNGKKNLITINESTNLGDCDWILGFIGEPAVVEKDKKIAISFNAEENGTWIGIGVIRNKRAYFYGQPEVGSKEKSFIVAGDFVYIYDENENWFYVKFQNGKKETKGWIKKSDTFQVP